MVDAEAVPARNLAAIGIAEVGWLEAGVTLERIWLPPKRLGLVGWAAFYKKLLDPKKGDDLGNLMFLVIITYTICDHNCFAFNIFIPKCNTTVSKM